MATLAAMTAAYQVQRPLVVEAAGFLGGWLLSGFHPPEGGSRWSGARATVRFPDPGPGIRVRVELDLSGWRRRGETPPRLALQAGTAQVEKRVGRARETLSLETATRGVWRSDLEAVLHSETFTPGPSDPRRLGVRLERARLVPLDPLLAPRVPPLRPLAMACAAVLLCYAAGLRLGLPVRAALRLAVAALGVLTALHAMERPWALLLTPATGALAGAAWLLGALPRDARSLAWAAARDAGAALRQGALALWRPRTLVLAGAGVLATVAAHRGRPVLEIDLGSHGDDTLARDFGPPRAWEGRAFREVGPRSRLDLAALATGRLRLGLTASRPGPARESVLAESGGRTLRAALTDTWREFAFEVEAPLMGHALDLTFPAQAAGARLHRVRVDRTGTWPAAKVVAGVTGAGLLVTVALAAVGASARAAATGAAAVPAILLAALWAAPAAGAAFAATAPALAGAALAFAVLLAAGNRRLERRYGHRLAAPALAAALGGFLAWAGSAAFPHYRGGNFVLHASVAQRIWRGEFLEFWLPTEANFIARHVEFGMGNLLIPHPTLYHTVVAPLASLPAPAFHLLLKVAAAAMLAAMAVLAGLLASRAGGGRAAAFAAVLLAGGVPGFQLLGLGHFMTVFGCFTSSLALAFVAVRVDALPQPRVWWAAAGLLVICFLSYTTSVAFAAGVLLAAALACTRTAAPLARALAGVATIAATVSFLVYYAAWAWPFVTDTVPLILAKTAEDAPPLWSRALREPRKLAYTYGHALVPIAGLGGLALLPPGRERLLVASWGAVLVVVSGLDLWFNFLLKHHYFVMVPVAAGGGVLLARLHERGRAGAGLAWLLLGGLVAVGARTALDVALGRLP